MVVKNTDSTATLPRFKFQLDYLLSMWLWTNYLASLCLNFLLYNSNHSYHFKGLWRLNGLLYIHTHTHILSGFSSVAQSCLTLCNPMARPPYPSPTPRVYSNLCPLSRWCHPTISSCILPCSTHLQSFPAPGSFQMSQFFTSGGQSTEVSASASILSMNMQDWFPLGQTGWISLQFKWLSRVFSNTTVQKHQFFGTQLSL